jgi:ATP-binding cassette subfamily B protein
MDALQGPMSRLFGSTRFQMAYRFEGIERVLEALALPIAPTGVVAIEPRATGDGTGPAPLLVLDAVGFDYPAPDETVPSSFREHVAAADGDHGAAALVDVSFAIRPGEVVALVGESGSGKSTLARLAVGLAQPTSGTVRWAGPLDTANGKIPIAYVAQDTWLFHDTIRANIGYARPDAGEAEIIKACIAAKVHASIRRFPLGYNTVVGERGARLSGGERQRLAIARALLVAPQLVVLDEPTAHLDSETEAQLQEELRTTFVDTAQLIVAHRLSTIRHADQILVMDRGRIVQRGTHDELLSVPGRYRDLYATDAESDNAPT